METKEALALIYKSVSPVLEENGFEPIYPPDVRKNEIPIEERADKLRISFQGGKGAVRIEYKEERMVLLCTEINASEATDEDYKQASLSLFDPSTADDKDIRYIGNEFSDTVRQKFGKKDRGTAKTKLSTPVSKSAAKSGALAYDPNTLASRFTTMYPELREMYKANVEKYGDFLAEEFFREYGTPAAMQTIRQNDKQRMKKLFNLLDDIYEDGTNETQSLIAVTILGAMHTDPQLVENAKEYMSETLAQPVLAVVRYLNSPAGKRAEKKLENPPPYKPKKAQKEKGIFRQMLGL